jgi:mRNA interferase MazF
LSLRIEVGGLYAADLNPPRGTEPGKIRPVLVVQSNLLNEVGHASTVVLPCTTRVSGESLLRLLVPKSSGGMRWNARS